MATLAIPAAKLALKAGGRLAAKHKAKKMAKDSLPSLSDTAGAISSRKGSSKKGPQTHQEVIHRLQTNRVVTSIKRALAQGDGTPDNMPRFKTVVLIGLLDQGAQGCTLGIMWGSFLKVSVKVALTWHSVVSRLQARFRCRPC